MIVFFLLIFGNGSRLASGYVLIKVNPCTNQVQQSGFVNPGVRERIPPCESDFSLVYITIPHFKTARAAATTAHEKRDSPHTRLILSNAKQYF